jgi:hypothetical protein
VLISRFLPSSPIVKLAPNLAESRSGATNHWSGESSSAHEVPGRSQLSARPELVVVLVSANGPPGDDPVPGMRGCPPSGPAGHRPHPPYVSTAISGVAVHGPRRVATIH